MYTPCLKQNYLEIQPGQHNVPKITCQQAGIILSNPGGWVRYLWQTKKWDHSLIKSELLLM